VAAALGCPASPAPDGRAREGLADNFRKALTHSCLAVARNGVPVPWFARDMTRQFRPAGSVQASSPPRIQTQMRGMCKRKMESYLPLPSRPALECMVETGLPDRPRAAA